MIHNVWEDTDLWQGILDLSCLERAIVYLLMILTNLKPAFTDHCSKSLANQEGKNELADMETYS